MTRRARAARWLLSAVCGLAVDAVFVLHAISRDDDRHDVGWAD